MIRRTALNLAELGFLRDVEALGGRALSLNLPQKDVANVKARNRCRWLRLVKYEPHSCRRGMWSLTEAGREALDRELEGERA
jgi:hypothetical protein